MDDKAIIIEILNAYQNGKVDWTRVPSLNTIVQQAVHKQVAEQADRIASNTESQYTEQLNRWAAKQERAYEVSENKVRHWQRQLDTANDAIKTSQQQQWVALIGQAIGLVALIFTLVVLCWVVVPMILQGTGLAFVWHILAPSFSWLGALRFVGALVGMALLIVLEVCLIAAPTYCVSRIWLWQYKVRHPFEPNDQNY
ncbi:hypothetical protein [Lactiplantibacillus plantarum]|uniref:hypothetical protein n=1 Tax=Lactiplantibacillus plantarum TaxID=1590 RepID=UPI0007AB6474|nr:hypothetical protein [Lactiplantibacillus plantarum]TXJ64867.1 hypothetical protein FGO87_15400 [Lactiplantibacillus plantarum]TXJ69137.1 hypothetical protein FGO88_15345 [Lactiplantibacillus plantarum]TXJ90203.1 hypothetical protein FFV23_15375 [Lactiplantibacillus plantarum]WEZ96236.1 hypothetical protein P3T69_17140 [Lactiplantibacillus plantarum]